MVMFGSFVGVEYIWDDVVDISVGINDRETPWGQEFLSLIEINLFPSLISHNSELNNSVYGNTSELVTNYDEKSNKL